MRKLLICMCLFLISLSVFTPVDAQEIEQDTQEVAVQEVKLFCIVKAGKVELDNGKEKRVIQKREFFGHKYTFNDNEVYPNTATALEDSEIFLMYKDEIEDLMEKDKSIGFNMFKKILKMLYKREQNER